MSSAGELLQSERVKRGRTLSDLASETCISKRYLAAIEEDDTKTLPGHFFHRNFIRQYASALGLDDSDTKRILSLITPVPEIDPIPALNLPKYIAEVEQQSKPLARIPTRVAATLLFLVLIGCSGLYAIWSKSQENLDIVVEPSVAQAAGPTAAVTQPVIPQTSPATESAASPSPPETGRIRVDLSATEKTWVSVSSAGRTVFAGVLDRSQTKNFALDEDATLLTGNAAGLDVRMNGRPLGPLGPRGQTREVLFTQDQYKILSPRKM
ncbi:MAG TPA: RodZ domain-containing protein [Bryobacteraceae bacterium]|nr:RodZ domain-containing protein [Bryobacteraceae bacterium]